MTPRTNCRGSPPKSTRRSWRRSRLQHLTGSGWVTRARARLTTPAPYSRSIRATAPSIAICASPISAMTARTRRRRMQHLVPAGAIPAVRGGGTDRRRGAALSRHADQPQPTRHDRTGLPGARRTLKGGRRRCRHSRRRLTRLPPDREFGRPAARGERHPRRRRRRRQGHRRTLRRAAVFVQRFSARNAAGRPHDRGSQAFTPELALRVLETAPAARTTVQSPLRWSPTPPGSSTIRISNV